MGTRFDIEVARHFHPEVFDPGWLEEGKQLSRILGLDSVQGMRRILERVRQHPEAKDDDALVAEVAATLRATEDTIRGRAIDLASRLQRRIGQGVPLTDLGDRVATPLQRARETNFAASMEVAS